MKIICSSCKAKHEILPGEGITCVCGHRISVANLPKKTPWAVICPVHLRVFLTEQQYNAQLDEPDKLWECPVCTRAAQFDEENYENFMED